MFSFNTNFWMQLGMAKENPFDKHFEKQDLQLTDLLDDDVIIGEFRNQHSKLMDFIQIPQILELVKYITSMPPADGSSKRQFRYPFYACELLCCQIPKVEELFFGEDKSAFNELLGFVQQNEEVNPVLAGYVSKVLGNLSRQKPLIFYKECYQNQNFIQSLVSQLQSRSIAEIIIKLICIEEPFLNERSALLKLVLDKIGQSEDFEVPQNVCQIVQELLSQAYVISNAQPLLDILVENLPQLSGQVINQNTFISLSAGEIIYQLLSLVVKNKQRQETDETVFQFDTKGILNSIGQALPSWIQYLSTKEKLGQNRVKLVEIICYAINLQQEGFPLVLAQQNIFSVFNEMLALHDKNNIFQLIYQRFLQAIIEHKYMELVQNVFLLILQLFVQCEFTNFLISLTRESNVNEKKGYFGFITKFAKFLEDSAHKDPSTFGQYIETEEWKQFRVQYFEKAQQISEQELGGLNKKQQEENTIVFDQLGNGILQMTINGDTNNEQQVQPEAQQIQNLFDSFNIQNNEQTANVNWTSWSTVDQQAQSWDQKPNEPQFFGDIQEQNVNQNQETNKEAQSSEVQQAEGSKNEQDNVETQNTQQESQEQPQNAEQVPQQETQNIEEKTDVQQEPQTSEQEIQNVKQEPSEQETQNVQQEPQTSEQEANNVQQEPSNPEKETQNVQQEPQVTVESTEQKEVPVENQESNTQQQQQEDPAPQQEEQQDAKPQQEDSADQ